MLVGRASIAIWLPAKKWNSLIKLGANAAGMYAYEGWPTRSTRALHGGQPMTDTDIYNEKTGEQPGPQGRYTVFNCTKIKSSLYVTTIQPGPQGRYTVEDGCTGTYRKVCLNHAFGGNEDMGPDKPTADPIIDPDASLAL